MRVHVFPEITSAEVYDALMAHDRYSQGDTLIVEKECVVGFLCGTWPVAVTIKAGEFHWKLSGRLLSNMGVRDGVDYVKASQTAISEARHRGYPVNE